ncbi:signal transducer and activator of transcription B [Zeugodacus cucurbitae]|uniref:signal transducer and activator of transcription B n=1 Tax=Zeugodacus cucurbitae TaxID=28588 RepID=UPI0023D90818|nr:signal transducer and activator of transcription B [Zeugodacus cucurbitae]
MNNRNKRARLELSLAPATIDAGIGNSCAINATDITSNIGGTPNIFLGNSTNSSANSTTSVGMLPTNVFLTICDENSDESQEYLAIGNTLTPIKQEHTDTLCSSSTQATQTLPLQYRLVNQIQRQPHNIDTINNSSIVSSGANAAFNAALPMQLPNGCEIYIVKEYVDNVPTMLTDESELLQGPPSPPATETIETIKLEPDSCVTSTACAGAATSTTTINGVQILRNTPLPLINANKSANATADGRTNTNRSATTVTSISAPDTQGNSTKRSCILEAYKKRDDKRRATHNEVERRRRDKINNWIFKLKEMLPTEGVNNNNNNNNQQQQIGLVEQLQTKTIANSNTNNNNSNSSNRTPPNDSKSQILIKACEYIKTMQDEIKSLRECLSENENLRLSNQRLQNELTKLQRERGANLHTRNFNSNFNITLNSLNSNNSNGSGGGGGGSASSSPGGTGNSIFGGLNIPPHSSNTNTYTKRELIIRDYVD